jgi:hypothetical protein
LSRINYSVKIDERLADRLRYRAQHERVPMRTIVDRACSSEIAIGEGLISFERPGDCAREMFRRARPEVPR